MFYRGKELQKRLSERARELEADNKDRQREREEIEDLKLRMLASNANITPNSGGTPSRLIDLYKKPLLDVTNSGTPPSATQLITGLKADPIKIPIASRLQALANNQSTKDKEAHNHTKSNNKEKDKDKESIQKVETSQKQEEKPSHPVAQPISFKEIQLNSFVPVSKPTSNQSTPNSLVSPLPIVEASPSPNTKGGAGFQMTIGNSIPTNSNATVKKDDDEDSRQSFGSAPSPGMVTPQGILNDVTN